MGADIVQQAEGTGARRQLRNGAFGIVQVAEKARPAGAGLDTGRDVLVRPNLAILGFRLRAGPGEPVDAEGALFDHTHRTRDGAFGAVIADHAIGIEILAQVAFPFRRFPVEVAHTVWTGHGAEAAADTALIVLPDQSLAIDVSRLHRADLDARRVIAVHAGSRHVAGLDIGIFPRLFDGIHGRGIDVIP